MCDVIMVGMRVVQLVCQHEFWPEPAKRTDHSGPFGVGDEDTAVRQPKVLADIEFKYPGSFASLGGSPRYCPTSAHLALCDVKRPGSIAQILQFQYRPADSKLKIIRMSEHCKDIDMGHTANLTQA